MPKVWIESLADVSTRVEPDWWLVLVNVQIASDEPFEATEDQPAAGSVEGHLYVGDRHDETLVANFDQAGQCRLLGSLKNSAKEAELRIVAIRTPDGRTYTGEDDVVSAVVVERPRK